MLKKINIDRLNEICVFLMFIVIIFDPANKIFKMKELMLLISLCLSVIMGITKKIKKEYIMLILGYFLLPNLYSGSLGILLSKTDFSLEFYKSYIFGSLFSLFLLNISFLKKEKIISYFFIVLSFCCILSLFLIINFNISLLNINEFIYNYSLEKENLMVGFYNFKNYRIYTIFYKTCPIIFIYYSYLIYRKNIFSLVVGIVLLMSGTSANVLSLGLITFFFVISLIFKKWDIKVRLLLLLIFSIIGILLTKDFLFSSDDLGNNIKYGHLVSYINLWTSNFKFLFFGTGLGAGFYSYGRNTVVFNTELTYFEIFRIYGFFVASFMIFYLFYPLIRLIKNKENEWLFISYLAYLFIGGTNPLILGSTGAITILFVYRVINEPITNNKV